LRIDVSGGALSVSEALRGRVVRRVLLSLSRFGPRIRRVTVSLAEPENPLGGIDRRCRMRAWITENGELQAEAINGGFDDAVARAATQLSQRVRTALEPGGSAEAGAGREAKGPGKHNQRRRAR
jgi:ribosome-associated translation inhibitor RaiA